MRKRTIPVGAAFAIAAACLVSQPVAAGKPAGGGGAKAPAYVAQPLGTLPGDKYSWASDVSIDGSVVGTSQAEGGEIRAFFWTAGAMSDITPAGYGGQAIGISDNAAFAVGYVEPLEPDARPRAVIWSALSSPDPTYIDGLGSDADDVNDSGTVVGSMGMHAVIWTRVGDAYLRTQIEPAGFEQSYGEDISNDGVVIGVGYRPAPTGESRAFVRLVDGTTTILEPLDLDPETYAHAVSDAVFSTLHGVQVVYVAGKSGNVVYGPSRAVRWTIDAGTGTVLDTLELTQDFATGVNNLGHVAGTNNSARSTDHASLYRDGSYVALKPPKGGNATISGALTRSPSGTTFYACGRVTSNNVQQAARWVIK